MFALTTATTQRRVRNLACLPIKFTQTTRVKFFDFPGATTSHMVTFSNGAVITDLIVTDFDDFSSILQYRDGRIAYGVPNTTFVAKPNF